MAESSVSAHNDDKKFLLLPEDGNHDVAIFGEGTDAAAYSGREGRREGGKSGEMNKEREGGESGERLRGDFAKQVFSLVSFRPS